MSDIKLIHTGGPYGDSTSNYTVITDASTLGELMNALVGRDNYQTFCLRKVASGISSDDVCLAYAENAKVLRTASNYDSMLSLEIGSVTANGGWGSMTYNICVKGSFPTQDREEFQKVYWGRIMTQFTKDGMRGGL